jgi:two-component system, LytTR family, response regulator LytT
MKSCGVLIVEDEQVIAEAIAEILRGNGYSEIWFASSVEEAMESVEEHHPAIVLTDINLGTEKTGIDLGHQLLHRYKIPFIYITSYSSPDIVGKAKHTRPNAYILKPFRNEDLLVAIELALFNANNRVVPPKEEDGLVIREGRAMANVSFENITLIETTGNYSTVNVFNGRKRLVRFSIDEIESRLKRRPFIRIHESYLINGNYITETRATTLLVNGRELPIGTNYLPVVESYFRC